MNNTLSSNKWAATMAAIKSCHLSLIDSSTASEQDWIDAFNSLTDAISDERKLHPAFAAELALLSDETGSTYDFTDILEEYFDYLEDNGAWTEVISSCEKLIDLFKWESALPSQYMFRKGNALEKMDRMTEAEAFGKEWLTKYPTDLYAAASNVFLLLELGRLDEAKAMTEKYLRTDYVCDNAADTFYMAAYRLYEMTDDINAKQRLEEKMSMSQKLCK